MRSRRHAGLAALVACAVLAACGVTGETSGFRLALDLPREWKPSSGVRVAPAGMSPDAAILNAVNVRPWGKFDADDLRNLEQSLSNTIAARLPEAPGGHSVLHVHVIIRRYVVSVSNTGGAVLANVAWAVTDAEGRIVNQEAFYAADAGYVVGTIGALKNAVHKSIVRRIATTALALAAVPSPHPSQFEGTYAAFEEAAAHLPETMVSMGNPSAMAFPDPIVGAVGILTPSGMRRVQWNVAEPSDDFDWKGYLDRLSADQ